jgi:3,4-dihydroxy 2-butanone 4-phosphate synthase/GTP cyclohydrolase II
MTKYDARAVDGDTIVETVTAGGVERVGEAALPARYGTFRIAAFRVAGVPGEVVALIHGSRENAATPLVRVHSECLTGDVLGSLRCDCGDQLKASLVQLTRARYGILLYLRQEGRGIGIVNKIRAYALQDEGLDTVDANLALGLPADGRDYGAAAAVLRHLGVRQARLLTNNPAKHRELERGGVQVLERVPLLTLPNATNGDYLRTKAARLGHLLNWPVHGEQSDPGEPGIIRATRVRASTQVTVHYAQTLDGRIATRTGQSQWISCDATLGFAHQIRADHQAVMVGVGTVCADNPRLTVRRVPGDSPRRIVVDSSLRVPLDSHVLADGAASTLIATTQRATAQRVQAIRALGAEVLVADQDAAGRVDLPDLLRRLRERDISTVLIEGGSQLITSALQGQLVDRLIVCIAPKVVGSGIEAVGNLDILHMNAAIHFAESSFTSVGDDVIFEGAVSYEQ